MYHTEIRIRMFSLSKFCMSITVVGVAVDSKMPGYICDGNHVTVGMCMQISIKVFAMLKFCCYFAWLTNTSSSCSREKNREAKTRPGTKDGLIFCTIQNLFSKAIQPFKEGALSTSKQVNTCFG